jgi:hypothetical protein
MTLTTGARLGAYEVTGHWRRRDGRGVSRTRYTAQPRRGGRDIGTQLTRPRYLEAFYDVAPDGRSFVVVKGHGAGTSDVVVAEGLLASTATGGQQ